MAITQVAFTQPFIFSETIDDQLYHIEVPTIFNTQTGIMYGYLDAALATALIDLDLAVLVT